MDEIQWQVFTFLVDRFEAPLLASLDNVIVAFADYARVPLWSALTLHIVFTGLLLLYDQLDDAFGVVARRLVTMVLVAWLVTEPGTYQYYVQTLFFDILPRELAGALTNGGATGPVTASSFDQVWLKSWRAGLEVWRASGTFDFGEKFLVAAYWLIALGATAIFFAIWLISRLLLALSIALGPLLVGLALFPATRAVFERWIGAMLSSVLLQVATVVLLFITLTVGNEIVGTVARMGNTDPTNMLQVLFAGIVFFFVAGYVAVHLPAYASSLAGGLTFHTNAVARALTGAASAVAGPAAEQIKRRAEQAGEAAWHLQRRLRTPPGNSLSRGRPPKDDGA